MSRVGLYVYPWDIAIEGVGCFLDRVEDLGVGRVYVATCYHSASLIAPRRSTQVALLAEANAAHLPLAAENFTLLKPQSSSVAGSHPELFYRLYQESRSRNIEIIGWTIACHNSYLAQKFPQVAIENCFGDRFAHGLCPANPLVQNYLQELATSLLSTGVFDRLMFESLSYLLPGHGHPHELWAVRLDKYLRSLLALCFCPACLDRGRQAGIDADRLRQRVAQQLSNSWNSPLGQLRSDDQGSEIASRLLFDQELAAWFRLRCSIVSELAAAISQLAHRCGIAIELASAVFGRPASYNWSEGIDFQRQSEIAAKIVLASYYPEIAEVASELDFALSCASADRFSMIQTLWPSHHSNLDGLLAKIDLALSAGIRDISLYNYSMVPAPLLDWVRAVVSLCAGKAQLERVE